ncbi:NAD(P)/FAD-dependent oxidoreductase [Rheinheimera tangshanensis]|uniref:NAD(P)-binding protein n=1 Tax=Rheinheimera tangshanensis TaxID=400153 RepID=A0A5C8LQR3_9GAMM|nr:FAD-dependent oxidoreductase [Rheinheimera tangshanensis]TXK79701.1 NAD(P)-binding protein [Rheinheimera tangshanensis]GGM66975.1 FAD-dependent oxidoreductase [Rheinheimera tangshanensis]
MKIAVIGGGISGMISWYLLQRQHEVTLFEAGSYLGGHTATVDVNVEGKDYAIDTGFIVFNNWTYPLFNKFLAELQVESQHTQMSFSVKKADTGLEYNGHTLSTLFAQRRNLFRPSFWRMLLDIVKFNKLGKELLEQNHPDLDLLIDEFLAKHNLGKALRNDYLLPMGAAIWSSGLADMPSFPLRFFLQFFKNHGLLNVTERPQWSVIKGGSRQYVRALLNTLNPAQLKLNSPVKAVNRDAEGVTLEFIDGRIERFDQVVFACHSDQALALLKDASDAERQVLGGIAYQNNDVILHTDDRILPQRKAAWAAWNYHLTDAASSHATLSYNMNILQGIEAPVTFVVTLNHSNAIDQNKILKRFQYAHPVFNHCTIAAQQRRGEINGVNHSWFCGAYWYNGFHEDGVRSAVDIARAMGVEF